MQWWEYLIIIGVSLFTVTVITISAIRRIKGKTSCDGNCHNCCHCKK